MRATQIATVVSVATATVVLALPAVVDALRDGSLAVPEPWRTLLIIVASSAATATVTYRTQGGGTDAEGQ